MITHFSFIYSLIKSSVHTTALQLLLVSVFFITPLPALSQEVEVRAITDTNSIVIGQQFNLIFEVELENQMVMTWPALPDTFSFMEVLERFPVDTVPVGTDGAALLRQKFVLTSFDSGYHVIHPFIFSYTLGGDTSIHLAESNPVLVTVNTVPVDIEKEIKDIKGQVGVPFTWQDALPYILGLAVLLLIIYLVRLWLKNRKQKPAQPAVPVIRRPAHEIALEALRNLDESKLWQKGNHKGYHSGISDIIRTFIENRWGINAMEMTTDEIIRLKVITDQSVEIFGKLKYLLELSDLVKFARMIPVVYENETSMQHAVDFVNANMAQEAKKEAEV